MSKANVHQKYQEIAPDYDQRWQSYINRTLSFLDSWAEIPTEATVLDLPCGTGEFEHLLLAKNPTQKIVGVDISEAMLQIAQQKYENYPNVSFHTAKASDLPFDSNCFDRIICANSFHYFDDPIAALNEMKRVLNPNGKLIILDWCRDYLSCKILDFVLKIFDSAYQQSYTQEEFHNLLMSAKWNIDRASKVRLTILWGLMVVTATQIPSD